MLLSLDDNGVIVKPIFKVKLKLEFVFARRSVWGGVNIFLPLL